MVSGVRTSQSIFNRPIGTSNNEWKAGQCKLFKRNHFNSICSWVGSVIRPTITAIDRCFMRFGLGRDIFGSRSHERLHRFIQTLRSKNHASTKEHRNAQSAWLGINRRLDRNFSRLLQHALLSFTQQRSNEQFGFFLDIALCHRFPETAFSTSMAAMRRSSRNQVLRIPVCHSVGISDLHCAGKWRALRTQNGRHENFCSIRQAQILHFFFG